MRPLRPDARTLCAAAEVRARRSARRGADAQAMVEFALVIALVLLLVLGVVQTGLYVVERSVAFDAGEAGVMAATEAAPSPAGSPATGAVPAVVTRVLNRGLLGAHGAALSSSAGACPHLSSSWPVGTVYVCATRPTSDTVAVTVRGWVPALVPPSFGLAQLRTGALAIDVTEVAHVATFAP